MITDVKNVAIIGAGLGGLATALAIRKQGIDVQVYEKAKEFGEAGSGLALFPNGLKFLETIEPGIVETIKNSGCPISRLVFKNISGETIKTTSTDKIVEKYGQTIVTVWWYRLQKILASLLPEKSIHLDCRCIGWEQSDDSVIINFENGKTVQADLVIGADGLNSVVRNKLVGDGEPRYLRSMSWRAVIKCEQKLLNPNEIVRFISERQFLFLINVGNGYLSWVTRKFAPECHISTNVEEMKSRILQDLTNWAAPIRHLIEITPPEKIFESPICDRLPISSWSQGRVTLVGDAAHPMSPSMGQGANSTFEDAWVLAQCISLFSTIEEALIEYEKKRSERTKIIQIKSAEGENNQWKTDHKTKSQPQRRRDLGSDFTDWLYNYKPFTSLISN